MDLGDGEWLQILNNDAGQQFEKDYLSGNTLFSPWHDIPYRVDNDDTISFVCEIPKFTKKKMECYTGEPGNPIAQDTNKDGSLREYHGPIYWNYGFVP